MGELLQASFSRGEVSPGIYGRVDIPQYQISLRKLVNFFVRPTGGVSNRAGTQYVYESDSAGDFSAVLIPFVYSIDISYVLEFYAGFVRVSQNGASVTTVATPYSAIDVLDLRYTQSADVLTVFHPNYPIHELRRLTASSFAFVEIEFNDGPFLDENVNDALTVYASAKTGTVTLTASNTIFVPEHVGSLFRLEEENLSAIKPWEANQTLGNEGVQINGMLRRSDGKVYRVVNSGTAITGKDWFTGATPPTHINGAIADGSILSTGGNVSGAVWQYVNSGYGVVRITGFISSSQVTADVIVELPDSVVGGAATAFGVNVTSIWAFGAWSQSQGYPSVGTYYGDRLVCAATPLQPQTEWASRVAKYNEFGKSVPTVDSDPITQTLNARQINSIRELVPLDQLISMTATSSWASPQRGQVWTQETIGFSPQSFYGCAPIRSIQTGDAALYVENFQTRIRDLRYQFDADKFVGAELTVLARHLFTPSNPIIDMDYQNAPHGILWPVRLDGTWTSCTYLKEQEVVGWARHETQGQVERVCCLPESGGDATYLLVRRNGKRFVERMHDRDAPDDLLQIFLDSSLTYDGRNLTSNTMSLAGTAWGIDEQVALTANYAAFSNPSSIGDEVHFPYLDANGEQQTVRIKIEEFLTSSLVDGVVLSAVPESLRNIITTNWGLARNTFSGLDHLEGMTVGIQVDGAVEADQVVTGGTVTLSTPGLVVHIGLKYVSDLETLDVTIQGARMATKNIPRVGLVLQDSATFKAGPTFKDKDLMQYASRTDETYTQRARLTTDVSEPLYIPSGLRRSGRVCIRQDLPAPLTILSIIPEVQVGNAG